MRRVSLRRSPTSSRTCRLQATSSPSSPTRATSIRLTMQTLARETNLSETVFVLPPSSDDADVRIRIFTPARELPFAGHPTLGSAFVLGGPLSKIVIRIETDSGVVPVELTREGPRIVFGEMEQPIPPWKLEPNARADLRRARRRRRPELPVERYDLGPGHVYVALGSPEEVAGATTRPGRARSGRPADGVNCFAHVAGAALEDAHVRARARRRRGPRHRVRSRPAGRSISRVTDGSRSASRSRSRRGPSCSRPSTLYAQVERRGRSHRPRARRRLGRRRRARRVQLLSCNRLDLRQLDGERSPEHAAVAASRRAGCGPRRPPCRGRPRRSPPHGRAAGRGRTRARSRLRRARRRSGASCRRPRPPSPRRQQRRRRRGRFSSSSACRLEHVVERLDLLRLEIDREAARLGRRRSRSSSGQHRGDNGSRTAGGADRREAGAPRDDIAGHERIAGTGRVGVESDARLT